MLRSIYISVLLLSGIALSAQDNKGFEFRSLPYLQNMTNDGVTVISVAGKSCFSYVSYGETKDLNQKAFASHHGQIDANVPVQKIRLSNLKPGTTYYYQVISKEINVYQAYKFQYGDSIISPLKSFTLPYAEKSKFSFLAFNDVHSAPAYIDSVCLKNPDFDFVCYNGDMLDYINNDEQIINQLCNPSAKYFGGSKPFVFARGNHETRGAGARSLIQYLDSPNGEYYYTFVWGNTCFIILDTGEDKVDTHPEYAGLADYKQYLSVQTEWMKKVMASREWKNAKHRIVCGHIPASLEPNKGHLSQLNNANVDMYICGHTHQAKIERPGKFHDYTLVIGGGPVRDKQTPGTTFIKVNVDGQNLNVELHRKDGTLIDHYTAM